ncbi:hypothetical protein [Pleomorphomonas sp. PLEO]|uniref:hypothetical protein n=1 Tax=Pleomorphomonas sp. PLEO TaxID=3239306 RepID=UPI00351F1DE6
MRLSIATLIVGALLVGTANAAPPDGPPPPSKHRVVTCDQARPGTGFWKQCHPKKPPRHVRQPPAPDRPGPAGKPGPSGKPGPGGKPDPMMERAPRP